LCPRDTGPATDDHCTRSRAQCIFVSNVQRAVQSLAENLDGWLDEYSIKNHTAWASVALSLDNKEQICFLAETEKNRYRFCWDVVALSWMCCLKKIYIRASREEDEEYDKIVQYTRRGVGHLHRQEGPDALTANRLRRTF